MGVQYANFCELKTFHKTLLFSHHIFCVSNLFFPLNCIYVQKQEQCVIFIESKVFLNNGQSLNERARQSEPTTLKLSLNTCSIHRKGNSINN